MLISSKSTLTKTPRTVLHQIPGHLGTTPYLDQITLPTPFLVLLENYILPICLESKPESPFIPHSSHISHTALSEDPVHLQNRSRIQPQLATCTATTLIWAFAIAHGALLLTPCLKLLPPVFLLSLALILSVSTSHLLQTI